MEALNRAKQEAKACDEIEPRVNAHVKITFAPTEARRSPSSAGSDDVSASSALGGCLVGKVYRSIQTGPFRGPPVRLERAYVLAPLAQPAPRPIRY